MDVSFISALQSESAKSDVSQENDSVSGTSKQHL